MKRQGITWLPTAAFAAAATVPDVTDPLSTVLLSLSAPPVGLTCNQANLLRDEAEQQAWGMLKRGPCCTKHAKQAYF